MKREIDFNLIGTLSIPRCIASLINQRKITMNDYAWYTIFAQQAEFGHKYTTIGVVTAGDKIIGKQLNYDPTTVNKKRNKLIRVGLLKTVPEGTKISNYQLFTQNRKSGVVPTTTSVLENEGQEGTSKLFQNEELFMKKRQEIIENQSYKSVQKL